MTQRGDIARGGGQQAMSPNRRLSGF